MTPAIEASRGTGSMADGCGISGPRSTARAPVTWVFMSSLSTWTSSTRPTVQNGYLFQLSIFSMGIINAVKRLRNHQPRRRPKGGTYQCQSCRTFFKAEQKICSVCGSTSTRVDRCSDCKVSLADGRTQSCPRCGSTDTRLVE